MVTGGVLRFLLYCLVVTWENQVARDSQLLDTARDCFHFVTKFYEPINVSATHIYHSALELSPVLSIVRKLYYDRCHGVTRVPRVVIGTPDSWDTAISVSGKHGYGSCAWSPCGQFVAAHTGETVEIRNHLTFELFIVLKSTKYTPLPTSPLAYSPDGRSLACGFSGGIVIWDIQTGGVANEIGCRKCIASLTWSLDGSMVAITLNSGGFVTDVETFNVFSGERLFTKQSESQAYIYLWAHEKSFRLMEAVPHADYRRRLYLTYTISEIGPTLIEIESSSLDTGNPYAWKVSEIAFSPSTHHFATLGSAIFVYDIRTSHRLLEEYGSLASFQFSPDGSHFASFGRDALSVFWCTSGRYTLLWKSESRHEHKPCLQFSPTSSSILSQHDGILQARRLSDLPIAESRGQSFTSKPRDQSIAISHSGRRIATAYSYGVADHRPDEETVTIIDLHSRDPPQFIDMGPHFYVKKLEITGNVLVAMGVCEAAAWLLTEEGIVGGVFDHQRASNRDSKWTLDAPLLEIFSWNLRVEGKVGVIQGGSGLLAEPYGPLFYCTETGDVLKPSPEAQQFPEISPKMSTKGGLHRYIATPLYLTYPQRQLVHSEQHNARGSVGNGSRRETQVLGACRVEEVPAS